MRSAFKGLCVETLCVLCVFISIHKYSYIYKSMNIYKSFAKNMFMDLIRRLSR